MRRIMLIVLAFCLCIFSISPGYAAVRKKKISSVSLTIDADITIGTEVGFEEIDVETSSEKYSVTDYYILNDDIEWTVDSVPKMEIILTAEDNYYFALNKASSVRLKGSGEAAYTSGKKRDSSTTLVLNVKLNCIQSGVSEVTDVVWDKNKLGTGTWKSSTAGNTYEVMLYRGTKKIGGVQEIAGIKKEMDFSPLMKTAGNYTFKVRERNPESRKKTEWVEVDGVFSVTEGLAQKNKELYGYGSVDGYGWQQDQIGWWYKTPGGYHCNRWLDDNGQRFYFNESGYMVTGWRFIDENWYYFNASGQLLKNITTPDGYRVDANGEYHP